jgi:hypothetical protein
MRSKTWGTWASGAGRLRKEWGSGIFSCPYRLKMSCKYLPSWYVCHRVLPLVASYSRSQDEARCSVHPAACIWPGTKISIDVIRATSRAQWISTSSNDPPASTCVAVGQTGQTGQPGSPMQERATRVHIIDGAGSRGPCPPHPSETKITPPTGQQGRQSRRDGVQPAADPRPLDGEGSECSLCSDGP